MRTLRILLVVLHILVGLGALAGGIPAILDPVSPLGASTELLKAGPFEDFFIPGLFLAVVLGAGNLAAAVLVLFRFRYLGLASGAMGAAECAWIFVQCLIMRTVLPLHVAIFLIGAVTGLAALAVLHRDGLLSAWTAADGEHR